MYAQIEKINRLKKEKNAVILAHYYQSDEIQAIADYLGDSLALARVAQETDADIILFCGVHFMAETAKILNPDKKVLLPDLRADCSLAQSADAGEFKKWVEAHNDHTVISYINCSTQVKALSDIICTSSNVIDMVNSVPKDQKICFAPDANLGAFVQQQTGRELEIWNGACHVHQAFDEKALVNIMQENPDAQVLAHPECNADLLQHADYIGSTGKMLTYAEQATDIDTFIVLTEAGIICEMQKRMPEKTFISVPDLKGNACNECEYMRMTTLDKVIATLESEQPEITMDEELRVEALKPLQRMLELSK